MNPKGIVAVSATRTSSLLVVRRVHACPGENTLEALVRSRTDLDRRAPVLEHLDDCPACRALVAELARFSRGSSDEAFVATPRKTYETALTVLHGLDDTRPEYELSCRIGLTLVELALGRGQRAVQELESIVKSFEAPDLEPDERAVAWFALARALAASHRDPARARTLATAAREQMADRPHWHAVELADIDAFLASQP